MSKLILDKDICIHCGVCVMMEYAEKDADEQKRIKADLPKGKWQEAIANCPVGAIQEFQED